MKKLLFFSMMLFATNISFGDITYTKEISRIFQDKCVDCHRPGNIAPMSFTTYEDIRPWAKSIKEQVITKEMPPWDADPKHGKFKNDISLTNEQIESITKWIDDGSPKGDDKDLPVQKDFNENWIAGNPDIELFLKEGFEVRPTSFNEDVYQCIILPYKFEKDTWISGVEYKPENREIVHHIIGFTADSDIISLDDKTPEPGFPCERGLRESVNGMIGGWAPGMPPNIYPSGIGTLVEANSYIVLQMHYHNESDTPKKDKSGIGIHLAKDVIKHKARIMPVSAWNINIPAGNPNAEHRASWKISRDVEIYTLMPHMHYIGKDMTVSLGSEILLSVPRYDFNWQTVYYLEQPRLIPKGSVVSMVSHHDNSESNPNNPSKPPIDVKWGESTTEEMAIAWISYIYPDENLNINP